MTLKELYDHLTPLIEEGGAYDVWVKVYSDYEGTFLIGISQMLVNHQEHYIEFQGEV